MRDRSCRIYKPRHYCARNTPSLDGNFISPPTPIISFISLLRNTSESQGREIARVWFDPDDGKMSPDIDIDVVPGYEGGENGFPARLVSGSYIPGKAFLADSENSFITDPTLGPGTNCTLGDNKAVRRIYQCGYWLSKTTERSPLSS